MRSIVLGLYAGLLCSFAAHAAGPSPLDPRAPILATPFRSAFEGYKSWDEATAPSWRDVNDTVRNVGGHAGAIGFRPGGAAAAGAVSTPPPGSKPDAADKPTSPHGAHHAAPDVVTRKP